MKIRIISLLVLLKAFIFSHTVLAQETTGIDVIVVTGSQSGSLTARTVDDAREAFNALAASASVIDAAGLQAQRTQTLADALRLAPGVFAAPRFGDEDLRLSIRGSGIVRTGHGKGVLLIRDGVAVNQADGNFDPPVFDFASASHISILRGTAALGVGASTLGGAIVVDSRTGLTHPGKSLGISGGSFGQRRINADAGMAGERFDGYVAVSGSKFDGFRDQSETSSVRVSGNTGYRHSTNLESRLHVSHARTDSEWPGTLTLAEFQADPRIANINSVARDQDNNVRHTLASVRTVWVTGDHSWSLGAGWSDRFLDHATPGGILEEDSSTVNAAVNWAFEPSDTGVALSAGLRAAATSQDALTFAYAGGPTSPQASTKGSLSNERDRRAVTSEAYMRLGYALIDDFTATLSLAGLHTTRRDLPGSVGSAPAFDLTFKGFMPGIGFLWRPGDNWSAFVSVSRTMEAPSFFDLGGNAALHADQQPRLRMQHAKTLEVGARGLVGKFRFDGTLYHARLEGELLRIDAAGQLNPPIVNADHTRRTGLELAIESTLSDALYSNGPSLTLAAKYDWSRFRFNKDPVYGSNIVAGIPEHSAYGEARLAFPGGFVISPNLTLRGRTYTDLVNTVSWPSELLYGVMASYESGFWRFWVEGRNLADRRWASSVNVVNRATPTASLYFPGDGRALFAGVTRSFE